MKVESEAVPDSPKEDTNSLSNDNGGNGSGGEQGGAGGSRSADGGRGGGARVLKKGPWTTAEDNILREYVEKNGEGNWNQVQKNSGLFRCGKSCRLRWANHLRPDLKKGQFSSEEQKLIIELHANMGNKWARMAAHLPGRTDNEIKNFWNTRIKRLQRSGAPIYPENVRSQVQHEDLHQNSGELCGKKRPNEFSQGDGFGVPEVIFDNFNYESQFADISLHNLLATNFVAQNSPSIAPTNSVKRLAVAGSLLPGMDCNLSGNQLANEPESALYSTDYDHACDFDSGKAKNLAVPIGDAIAGCHPTLNGNFSTSGSMIRSMKMELPSLQYTNNDPSCNWFDGPSGSPIDQFDSYFQSPAPSASVQSEGISQKNTDLLGALVQEGHGLGGTANSQGSVEVFIPTPMHNQMLQNAELGMCEEQHGGNSEFGFPMGLSAAAVLGECAIGGSSVEEFQTTKSPSSLNDFADTNDLRRSDAFPGSSMLDGSSQELKDQSINDTLAELFHGDSYDEYKLLTAGDLSVSGRQLGLDSFPWKSMPRACHMSDFPENL